LEWGQKSDGQRSEDNRLIDDNECAKQDIEEFVQRALFVMVASFLYSALNEVAI